MNNLKVNDFGPIHEVDVTFGDLTVLVGPQASGKSLFLELFKLIKDRRHIISTLRKYNYILSRASVKPLLDCYLGDGLSSLVTDDTSIVYDNRHLNIENLTSGAGGAAIDEKVFFIPAQRILSIDDGRPRNFMEFDITTPYTLRHFSETLRIFIQGGLGNPDVVFPMKNRLKGSMRKSINDTIFHNGKIIIDKSTSQRKMKLEIDNLRLPFMTWSAGQKEFLPLLLAIYCLSGPTTSVINKDGYEWVIIEEPEMGLHPRAIEAVMLQIIELMQVGYKVILSTHSPTILEFIWTLKQLPQNDPGVMRDALCELFGLTRRPPFAELFESMASKQVNTFYFSNSENGRVTSKDISSLDAMDANDAISEWGGLSYFAGKASEVVSRYAFS